MRTIVRFECIGDGHGPSNCWVAEIVGLTSDFIVRRSFVRKQKDYSQANSVGSRGVWAFFVLEYGKVYEISQPITWNKTDRYFCRVDDNGQVQKISMEEVFAHFVANRAPLPSPAQAKEELEKLWPNAHSASTSLKPPVSE